MTRNARRCKELKGNVRYAKNCNIPSRKYQEIEGYARNCKEVIRNAWKCKELQ